MLAQANLSPENSGPKMTIERPTAETGPSNGKLESIKTFLSPPISRERGRKSDTFREGRRGGVANIPKLPIGPKRLPTSPTKQRKGLSLAHSRSYKSL